MTRKQRPTQPRPRGPQAPGDATALRDFREAVQHLQAGRLRESEEAHRKILARTPRHAPSLHNLGLIAFRTNAPEQAVDYLRQSLAIDPSAHTAWQNLALVLGEQRRMDEAIEACRQCLALVPNDAKAHAILGNLLHAMKRTDEAMAAFARSIEIKSDQPKLLVRLGDLVLQSGKPAEAMLLCHQALALDPACIEAQALEQHILAANGKLDAAQVMIEARTEDPAERARLYDELASFLRSRKRFKEAIPIARRALAAMPQNAEYHFNLAAALDGACEDMAALASYQAGLAIAPEHALAYKNVGSLLRKMGLYPAAVTAYEHATKLDPRLADAHYNLATTYKLLSRFEEARQVFRRAIETAPDALTHRFEMNDLKRTICDWENIDEEESRCLELLRTTERGGVAPFLLISMPSTRADQLACARRFAQYKTPPEELRFKHRHAAPDDNRRIRIGYLSSDYVTHATAMLFAEVLERANRDRFELFGYCYSNDDGSALRRRLIDAFDHFTVVKGMTDLEAATRIHDDGIDILVDLKGYTRDARTEILGLKPAPIQVNYLGYPGTMGADFIDYIIADAVIAPMEHQPDYSERIVHLPNCYQPNDRQRKISDEPMTRADMGLPDDAFVFCSFNNTYKLNAPVFDVWMRLLAEVPRSVMWILASDEGCRSNLRREAAARGIDPDRLVFAGKMPIGRHLARHRLADLFLDTLPCNAHTTASDALWAGLPVLTCRGETFAGRVAASLLTAMDLPELIAGDLAEYERIALTLAREPGRLAPLRRKIVTGRETSALFDTTRYTRNLERAYETMVDIMRNAEAPRPFAVVESMPGPAAETPAPLTEARIAYEQCPLCDGADIPYQIEARVTAHPLYKPQLPPTVKWRSCAGCGHVFTEGYFTPEARDIVLSSTEPRDQVGNDAAGRRKGSARIVERVARHVPRGEWLDIASGNASLLFTAAEWGYKVMGTDPRIDNVELLLRLGYLACWNGIEDIEFVDRFSVVSMANALQREPFPRRSLAAAHRLLCQGGVLFLSVPNMDTIEWRLLDAAGANPYWGEIEHCHTFTRERLVGLLDAQGFKVAEYNVGEQEPSVMELIAIKA
jgi:protein O-GlcNAc transferase